MIKDFKIHKKSMGNKTFVMLYNLNGIYVEEYLFNVKQAVKRIKLLAEVNSINDFVVINMTTKVVQKFVKTKEEEDGTG